MVLAFSACQQPAFEQPVEEAAVLPSYTFSPEMVFPSSGSLNRPEDGVVLPDGRLVVTDQLAGLRLIEADGSTRPFGKMNDVGYVHNPPAVEGAANGVSISPDRTFLLVADIYQGGIYRVDIATEKTRKIYQHGFGVNSVIADSRGGIWFSQSTRNKPVENSGGLWKSVNFPVADGALCYLAPDFSAGDGEAVVLANDIVFANGLVLDELTGTLYLAETMGSKVWKFAVDVASGTATQQTLAFEVSYPDNLEWDEYGRIWIACPLHSEIVVANPRTGTVQSVFRISSQESEALIREIAERLSSNEAWLDLAGPALWSPAPAFMTGMVPDLKNGRVYATGLGNAILKLEE